MSVTSPSPTVAMSYISKANGSSSPYHTINNISSYDGDEDRVSSVAAGSRDSSIDRARGTNVYVVSEEFWSADKKEDVIYLDHGEEEFQPCRDGED